MKEVAYIRATGIFNDSRATKEINALREIGYYVHVIGWDRNGGAYEKCKSVFGESNISYTFFDLKIPNGVGGIKGIFKLLRFFLWTSKQLKKLKSNIDIVHACDLDTGFVAYNFCKKHKKPLVYDIYDYYIDSHYVPKMLSGIVEKLETKTIDFSEYTIICTEERIEQIKNASPKNLIVIHNSPEITLTEEKEIIYDYAYCGILSSKRLLSEIADNYENDSQLKFAFAGFGSYQSKFEELNEKYDNITYLGSISYAEVLDIESKSRVISAIYEPTIRNHRLCAPNKFYEALALGKPVIVCRGTGIDKIVEEHGIGKVIDYNADEFYNAVKYYKENTDECRVISEKSKKLYDEKYKWSIMKKKLQDIYKQF